MENPGHFRVMFRNDLVDWSDPGFSGASAKPRMLFARAIAIYPGWPTMDLDRDGDSTDVFCALATLHGLAHMVLAEKTPPFFASMTAREFMDRQLPGVLERLYPRVLSGLAHGPARRTRHARPQHPRHDRPHPHDPVGEALPRP